MLFGLLHYDKGDLFFCVVFRPRCSFFLLENINGLLINKLKGFNFSKTGISVGITKVKKTLQCYDRFLKHSRKTCQCANSNQYSRYIKLHRAIVTTLYLCAFLIKQLQYRLKLLAIWSHQPLCQYRQPTRAKVCVCVCVCLCMRARARPCVWERDPSW